MCITLSAILLEHVAGAVAAAAQGEGTAAVTQVVVAEVQTTVAEGCIGTGGADLQCVSGAEPAGRGSSIQIIGGGTAREGELIAVVVPKHIVCHSGCDLAVHHSYRRDAQCGTAMRQRIVGAGGVYCDHIGVTGRDRGYGIVCSAHNGLGVAVAAVSAGIYICIIRFGAGVVMTGSRNGFGVGIAAIAGECLYAIRGAGGGCGHGGNIVMGMDVDIVAGAIHHHGGAAVGNTGDGHIVAVVFGLIQRPFLFQ